MSLINFLNKHRFLLVISILFLIVICFIIIKLIIFKTYHFKPYTCTSMVDENTCLYNNITILKEPTKYKDKIFKEYENYINDLITEYNLPEFNNYTAYLYLLASNYDYSLTNRNETLNMFFNYYVNTYNLKEFYQKNTLFYDIFYPFKLI